MSLAGNSLSIKSLNPTLQAGIVQLFKVAGQAGAKSIRVTSARRSLAQQKSLYANFLAGRSLYPVAVPGTSAHEKGLAVDIVTQPMSALQTLGAYWKAMGGTWSPKDPIHFEYR